MARRTPPLVCREQAPAWRGEAVRPAASRRRRLSALALLLPALTLGACDRDPTGSGEVPPPPSSIKPLGLVEVTLTGIGGGRMSAEAAFSRGPSFVLNRPVNGDASGDGTIQMEYVSGGSFIEGTRGVDGQRYVWATFRVRNAQEDSTAYDTPRQNLTFLAVGTATTFDGTPVRSMTRFDGGAADPSLAASVVPTGHVAVNDSLQVAPVYADVVQVLTEDEAAAVTVPAEVENLFPYGFVVRNPNSASSRTLPASPGLQQFDGVVTFAFRLPLAADDPGQTNGASKDPYRISLMFMAVDDSETRVTESIEEQTAAGQAMVAARAAALGATVVTVLPGSSSAGYPGQRQVCSVRTAGPAGSATNTITMSGAYTRLALYLPGESVDACAANFRSGTASNAGAGSNYNVTARAMDRYGNVITAALDSVAVASSDPSATLPARAALVSGVGVFPVQFSADGTYTVTATGMRRSSSARTVTVGPMTVNWTGTVSSNWSVGDNWSTGSAPGVQDTASIPAGTPHSPELTAPVSLSTVLVADGATLSLASFDMTLSGSVSTGATGGVTGGTGALVLAGSGGTLSGNLPRLRVTGTYTMSGNVTSVSISRVAGGLLRNGGNLWRISG